MCVGMRRGDGDLCAVFVDDAGHEQLVGIVFSQSVHHEVALLVPVAAVSECLGTDLPR